MFSNYLLWYLFILNCVWWCRLVCIRCEYKKKDVKNKIMKIESTHHKLAQNKKNVIEEKQEIKRKYREKLL